MSGELTFRLFRDLALHIDGDNEEDTIRYFKESHPTDPASRIADALNRVAEQSAIDAEPVCVRDACSRRHKLAKLRI